MCEACQIAETKPLSALTYAGRPGTTGCINCEARDLAIGPQAKARARDPAALTAAMRARWPEVKRYQEGRRLLWAWIQRLEAPADSEGGEA